MLVDEKTQVRYSFPEPCKDINNCANCKRFWARKRVLAKAEGTIASYRFEVIAPDNPEHRGLELVRRRGHGGEYLKLKRLNADGSVSWIIYTRGMDLRLMQEYFSIVKLDRVPFDQKWLEWLEQDVMSVQRYQGSGRLVQPSQGFWMALVEKATGEESPFRGAKTYLVDKPIAEVARHYKQDGRWTLSRLSEGVGILMFAPKRTAYPERMETPLWKRDGPPMDTPQMDDLYHRSNSEMLAQEGDVHDNPALDRTAARQAQELGKLTANGVRVIRHEPNDAWLDEALDDPSLSDAERAAVAKLHMLRRKHGPQEEWQVDL